MKDTVLNRVLITEQLLNMFKLLCEWILSYVWMEPHDQLLVVRL